MDTHTDIQDGGGHPQPATGEPMAVGAILRSAREQQELSIDDVYDRIKFAPRQIESLEAGDYSGLPEGAFLRGFVRSYARMLQLDEKPLIAALPGAPQTVESVMVPDTVEVPFPSEHQRRNAMLLKVAAGAAGVVVLLAVLVSVLSSGHAPSEVSPPVAIEPVSAPVVAAASAVTDPMLLQLSPAVASGVMPADASAPQAAEPPAVVELPVHLVFEQASWAEVKDMRGTVLLSQRNTAGTEQLLTGEAPYFLAIARANGVRLYYKGKEINLAPHADANGVARLKLE